MDEQTAYPTFSQATRVSPASDSSALAGRRANGALMHRELVDERDWVREDQFLGALNFCHLLPGPEAQQLATRLGLEVARPARWSAGARPALHPAGRW